MKRAIVVLALLAGCGGEGGNEAPVPGSEGSRSEPIVCRSEDRLDKFCPADWEAAVAQADRFPRETCAGTCGRWLLHTTGGFMRVNCAYDPQTHELIGVAIHDDVPLYCDGTTDILVWGDAPLAGGCTFEAGASGASCPSLAD
ncbi:hypothetical protein [Vulgatibacter sp.]|uniref:hypothetical protein n=1 Tax=Vulgatibacter sp. TaxID=1971226 RepID=UPI0035627F4B